jgi:excisionase family DNA binding protein
MTISGKFTGTFNDTPGVFVGVLDVPLEELIGIVKARTKKVTRDQLAEHLGVSVPTIDRLKRKGKIPFLKVASEVRFEVEAVEAALRQQGWMK